MADSNRTGVFGLSDVRQRSLDGFWENVQSNAQAGWTAGGTALPGIVSNVDRLDFANDLAVTSARGPLAVATHIAGAVNTANYAWFAGGQLPAYTTTITRIQFATDSSTSVNRSTLTAAKAGANGIGNNTYGWFGGGVVTPATPLKVSTIERITYSSDTTQTVPRGFMSSARYLTATTTNGYYGWLAGGDTTSTLVDRTDFSNDTATNLQRGTLIQGRSFAAGFGNNTFGWIAGGQGPTSPTTYANIERIEYNNDTVSVSNRGGITSNFGYRGLNANFNSSYGWLLGGGSASPANNSVITRLEYSTDSVGTMIRGNLSVGRFGAGGASGILSYPTLAGQDASNAALYGFGWIASGSTNPAALTLVSHVDRIDFSNDTATGLSRGPLTQSRTQYQAVSNASHGWYAGGLVGVATGSTSVERIAFANDTLLTLARGFLSLSKGLQGATGNINYGWQAGGTFPGPSSLVDRIDYANDSLPAQVRGPLTIARLRTVGAGNEDYGWFGGGNTPGGSVTTFERIEYNNDLVAASVRTAVLSATVDGHGVVSNSNYGWWNGGTASTAMYRLDFSSDSTNATARGTFFTAKNFTAGSSNGNYGWFAGGTNAATPATFSTVERIDYTNDTVSAIARGSMSSARYGSGGSSNYIKAVQYRLAGQGLGTHGYATGGGSGQFGTGTSTVERLNFASDTTIVSRGPLASSKYSHTAIGNADYGWLIHGKSSLTIGSSYVNRMEFASDNMTSPVRLFGPQRTRAAGMSSRNYGWTAAGESGQSSVFRLEFANDTAGTSTRGPLAFSRDYTYGAVMSSTYGWVGGGTLPVPAPTVYVTLVERIDFANDNVTASTRGSLIVARYGPGGISNNNYGWFTGGYVGVFTSSSVIDRIDYSNDTVTLSQRGNLSGTRSRHATSGNADYGYTMGGTTAQWSTPTANVSRITYSNDTSAAVSRGSLGASVSQNAGTSNYVRGVLSANIAAYNVSTSAIAATSNNGQQSYGWIAGKQAPSPGQIDRITFDNDTVAALSRTTLIAPMDRDIAGVSTNNYGWFTGVSPGNANPGQFNRLDFGNDTVQPLVRGSVASIRLPTATGTRDYGYWVGGDYTATSAIRRFALANDTASFLTRSNMLTTRKSGAAANNGRYAWVAGGSPGPLSSITRIDFYNDTAGSVDRGPLTSTRYNHASTSNFDYGWFAGGNPGPTITSTIERVTFANDLAVAAVRGPNIEASRFFTGVGTNSYGWFAGGYRPAPSGPSSSVSRIDYASDTATAATRGVLAIARSFHGGVSNYVK